MIARLLCLTSVLVSGSRAPAAAQAGRAARDTVRVVAVGDINLGRSLARDYILAGRGAEVFAGVRDALRAADVAVANLESVILDRGAYTDPPMSWVFAGPRESAALLGDAGIDVVGTANNHAWDFGLAGLLESLARLDSAGIAHSGTGPTLADALRPAVFRRGGWTIAVFGVTYIFNYPDLTVLGHPPECCVAWADTLRLEDAFRAARDSLGADFILVSFHAGLEYRPVPPRNVIALARGLVRAGADAVVGHHPHVPQGMEWVDGKPILYSLGNFVFRQNSPWTDRGLWAEFTLVPGGPVRLTVRPLVVGNQPRFAFGADSAATMAHLADVSDRLHRLPAPRPRGNVAPPRRRTGTP